MTLSDANSLLPVILQFFLACVFFLGGSLQALGGLSASSILSIGPARSSHPGPTAMGVPPPLQAPSRAGQPPLAPSPFPSLAGPSSAGHAPLGTPAAGLGPLSAWAPSPFPLPQPGCLPGTGPAADGEEALATLEGILDQARALLPPTAQPGRRVEGGTRPVLPWCNETGYLCKGRWWL